ncbi:hypothetical protein MTBBW1_460010 [Desulfamplus magnetovallimortis]|uniref:Uncharacterized protein n=1 Tax=Desulfamplus magnetovallimortis TaxID=1246637 RepID=A0A1W1HHA0_9BACT|nr:hypothetical protein [Desulfamplus magnetovallimortis]SLM31854.1 hypothetical protein MTBBW1_460010 [Desulfamplus magnetovallimortis]
MSLFDENPVPVEDTEKSQPVVVELRFSHVRVIPGKTDTWGFEVSVDVADDQGGTPEDIEIGLFVNLYKAVLTHKPEWSCLF